MVLRTIYDFVLSLMLLPSLPVVTCLTHCLVFGVSIFSASYLEHHVTLRNYYTAFDVQNPSYSVLCKRATAAE